ncbi:excalibur calcium-binding domain-containing protein [Nitratifractor salsuginis]|uniref:Excalibur domain protein n=1 Tax=Nitratifractor salsuginis (strain DSM 16511 / JCM 12458 / E9I37-1) TaxID=749222 RepID=E6X1R1_NITSE|nr:excalibur calcium-binding domain-containing protein [Nitratifractor salsuginis]ADV47052.1 Excalibur domain protein [Nitratifractor salsuginis DSM 16511]
MRYLIIFALLLTASNARVSCKQMKSCAEACEYLADGYQSLDRDRDGIPCEKLCHRPCKKETPKKKKKKG